MSFFYKAQPRHRFIVPSPQIGLLQMKMQVDDPYCCLRETQKTLETGSHLFSDCSLTPYVTIELMLWTDTQNPEGYEYS
ncbi:hypothetical protein HAX54_049940 [Datura stramonium]|uniref:Uncharacterized protein n=1 Tax=Datura stramonium TaxID=4076 RepID=A0ABS8WPQ9_DATST|nr:hypothetical protein [Datura stramonium]